MIVDAHTHVGRSLQGYEQTVSALLDSMDRLGIAKAVVCPVRPVDYAYSPENDFIAETVTRYSTRFLGLGRVDPRRPDCAEEARRCLGDLGLNGLYLHPWEDAFCIADMIVDRIMEVCHEYQAPVLVASGYPWASEAPQVAELARRFPRVPIVMTNGGQINISGLGQKNAWIVLSEHPNVSITTSGVYREDFLEEVITLIDSSRVLFGSQSPLYDQDYELHRVLWAHVPNPTKEEVLGHNALRLFQRRP
jgi:predicted TIM-barrel fold metal-dependent hydrolase